MKKLRILLILLILAVIAAGLAWKYQDWLMAKVYLGTMEWEGRVSGLHVDQVIQSLEVEPGQRVADVGAGTGLFSRPLARAVGDQGIVYAVDINAELLRHIEERARRERMGNIRTVLCQEDDPLIPEPVDLIFFCDTLHHVADRGVYLKKLRRYLKPGGRLAVIDFGESSPHLLPSLQFTLPDVKKWMEEAGYSLVASHDFVDENFFIVYQCDSCPE